MDRYGDHALVCPCGGDRTIRHNAIRNVAYAEAVGAGLQPEKEKAGLLPGRPREDGHPVEASLRRPADVYLPRGQGNRGEILDFACSSGLRADFLQVVPDDPGHVFEQYKNLKRSYNNTANDCESQGVSFTLMIIEAHSEAWSQTAKVVWARLATAQSAA